LSDEARRERIVAARLALRQRFAARIAETPARADTKPLGSGPPNRHGMPRLPVGQTATTKWPVLDLGMHPDVPIDRWQLVVDGACARPTTLTFGDLALLEQVEEESDFHCVTTWSRFDLRFRGVRLAEVLALAEPREGAVAVMCHAHDGYSTNLALEEALKPEVLLAWAAEGAPLPREHGGPVRVITPELYAWKGAKWVNRLELMTENRPGFWEARGYSSSAHPWRDDRYG